MFLGTTNCRDIGSLMRNSLMHSFTVQQDHSHTRDTQMAKRLNIDDVSTFCTFGAQKFGGMYGNGMASNSDLHHIPMHSPT
jgi:hypothetical protein